MTDNDDFGFEEETPGEEVEDWGTDVEEKKGGGRSRLLLLVLLLVLIGAAGVWFFVLAPEDGPSAPVQVVTVPKKPVAMPVPPSAPVTPTAQPAEPAVQTVQLSPTAAQSPVQPVPATPAPDAAEKTPGTVAVETPETKVPVPVVKLATAGSGAYTLTAGSYLLMANVKTVTKKLQRLGYEPMLTPVVRTLTMIRLRAGVYSAVDAARKLKELKKYAPDAFSIESDGQVTVYAGSYYNQDQARSFADRLFDKNGMRLEEEPVQVKETLQRVTFGSFASLDEAKVLARQLAAKGLDAEPFKNR